LNKTFTYFIRYQSCDSVSEKEHTAGEKQAEINYKRYIDKLNRMTYTPDANVN